MENKIKLPFQVVRKDYEDEHFYYINEEFVPATTHILDSAGPVGYGLRNFWQTNTKDESEVIMNDAKRFGSSIHNDIEILLHGKEVNIKERADAFSGYKKNYYKHIFSFYSWFHEFNPDLNGIESELIVGSVENKYAGTVDLVCVKNDERWLIDFKTSSGIFPSHTWQVSAYKKAYEELTGKKINKLAILRTGSKHKAGYEFKEVDYDFEGFLNIYKTYLSLNGGKIPEPPKIDIYPEKLQLFQNVTTDQNDEIK